MPTEHPYAIHVFASKAIDAQSRRTYEAPLRYALRNLQQTSPLLGLPRRAVRRTR